MAEAAAVLTALGVIAALLPSVWQACDRHALLSRLSPPVARAAPSQVRHTDPLVFLSQVARSLRAGATPAQAIIGAPASSAAVASAQEMLRTGKPLLTALGADSPELRTLSACLHHGSLSVPAIEHSMELLRDESRLSSDIRTATALSRRSARILTSVPFALLGCAAVVSASVRSALLSPVVIVMVMIGTVLNRAGLAWMSASARGVTAGHSRAAGPLAVAAAIAAHLRAGGTLVSAFERLAAHHGDCAEVHTLLSAGAPLSQALAPLHGSCPVLADALLACHADGLPVAPAVDAVIADAAAVRSAAVREMVAELPARGTAPLVLLVLPSFLLLAVIPLALAVFRGLQIPRL